jgi:hypothetical protein
MYTTPEMFQGIIAVDRYKARKIQFRFILQLVEAAQAGLFEMKLCCIKSKGNIYLIFEMSANFKIHIICYQKLHGKVRDIRYLETINCINNFSRNINNQQRTLCMWLSILHCASMLKCGHVQWDCQ